MIVVTAPTSGIGRQIVDDLLAAGLALRLIARDREKPDPATRERVEVIEGLHGCGEVVARAATGADAVFWLAPPDPAAVSVDAAYAGFTRPGLDDIRAAGVPRLVGIIALGRGAPQAARAGFVTGSLAMEDLITASGVAYRAVACPSFFDNLLRQLRPIRERGMFFSAVDPTRPLPAAATRDIAAVAGRWLAGDSWTSSAEVEVLEPEDLSFERMAAIMSDVLGRRISVERVDYDAYKAQFLGFGMSDAMAQGMTDMARAKSDGLDNHAVRTADNTTPTGFRRWCEDVLRPAVLGVGDGEKS